MKEAIEEFLKIENEDLLYSYFEIMKIEFKKSKLYDDLSFINFCETVELYIKEFKNKYSRKFNAGNILLYGGF